MCEILPAGFKHKEPIKLSFNDNKFEKRQIKIK